MSELNVEKVPSTKARTLPIFAEFEQFADRIRDRAYKIFSARGFEDGHALDDWLEAERQVCWPAAELVEDDKEFAIEVALAGFDSSEVTVTATPDDIIIKATHKTEKKQKKDGDGKSVTHFSEFRSNRVFRHFELPAKIKVKDVSAKLKNGILKIEAPKSRTAKKQTRKVKVAPAS